MTDDVARRPGLGPILLTVFLDLLGFGLVIPLLGFYAESFDASPSEVTALMAIYSIAQLVAAPVWGMLSDRVGRRPVLLATILLGSFGLAAFATSTALWQLFLFRGLHGLAAANIGTAQAYVADVTRGADRAKGMGLIGAAFGVGFSLGPWMGGELSAAYGVTAPIWLASALGVLNFVWAFWGLPESRPASASHDPTRAERSIDPRVLWRGLSHPVVGLCLLLTFIAVFAFAMVESTFQLVAEHVWSMDARGVGRLFGVIGLVGIVIQGGLIRRLVPRFGEGRLVAVGYVLSASGLAMMVASAAGWGVWVGAAVMATGTSLTNPSLMSLISRATSADEQGAILGINQSFGALGRATAPLLGGLIFEAASPRGPMALASVMMFGAALLSVPATARAVRERAAEAVDV
jgi:DHA1 family tetracycline resistance protein-like MFS transporter